MTLADRDLFVRFLDLERRCLEAERRAEQAARRADLLYRQGYRCGYSAGYHRGRTGEPRPTLRDVAARAGVSHHTVKRVLAGETYGVSAQTRAKVEAAAVALGYVPRGRPRELGSQLREAA